MQSLIRYHLPPVLLAGILFILSSLPPASIPGFLFPGADKVAHAVLYFALAWLIHRSLSRQSLFPFLSANAMMASILIAIVYGLSDEWHQSFVPGRESSWWDLAADAAGAILFTLSARRGGMRKLI